MRFAAGCLARNECVLVQDDDILLPPETIYTLHKHWQEDRDVLHGLFGRDPRPGDSSYARESNLVNADVRVVLTRALVCDRKLLGLFFADEVVGCYVPEVTELQAHSNPRGNGEDIILGYVACWRSGRRNKVYALPRRELPAPDAIHARGDVKDHWRHRTRLMQLMEKLCNR